MPKTIKEEGIPSWDDLESAAIATSFGQSIQKQKELWADGEGKLRAFELKLM